MTDLSTSTVALLTPDQPVPDTLGGKGRALAVLVAAGLPVPQTGVVTTVAYRQVARSSDVTALVGRVASGEPVPETDVDRLFTDVEVPARLAQDIVDLAGEVGSGGPIAVRSSATVEDLHGSSFAGQYRSMLDVDSSDAHAVLRAVRHVWASLWYPAPAAYRRAFGIDESNVAMAVVLMEMIPATTAGVVFTVDPGGVSGAAHVEEVAGLGESLVSGERTPTAWVVPREGLRTDLTAAPEQALDLALAIEELTGTPQDVEWAAVGDEVMIVQARPITVLDQDDGFDTPIDDHELTTAGIVEMVPGVLSPLSWELNQFLLEEAFRSVLDSLGIIHGGAAEDRPFVRRVRGRVAVDFDRLRAAAAHIPGAVDELEYQYFGSGPTQSPPLAAGRQSRTESIGRDLRTLRTRRQVIEQADVVIRTTLELRAQLPELADYHDDRLLEYRQRLVDLAARGLAAELGVAAAGAAAYQRLETVLAGHLGPEDAARTAQSITVDSTMTEARVSSSSAALFAGPTWHDIGVAPPQPRQPDSDEARRRESELEQRLRSLPGWRRRRILTGQIVDVRIHLLRRIAADATAQLRRREATKAAFLELGGEVRRVHAELGRRLTERGLLDAADDIELLRANEIAAMTHGEATVAVDALGRRRNWLSRYEAEGDLPLRFRGVPERNSQPLPTGDVLTGWAASPGRRRGVARVISGPGDELRRGDILVAAATDASWSPLFVRAGAIVVERGGPLSHAAILARELGLPAVLNLPGATGVLEGCTVVVDGDQGVVVIESRPGES